MFIYIISLCNYGRQYKIIRCFWFLPRNILLMRLEIINEVWSIIIWSREVSKNFRFSGRNNSYSRLNLEDYTYHIKCRIFNRSKRCMGISSYDKANAYRHKRMDFVICFFQGVVWGKPYGNTITTRRVM